MVHETRANPVRSFSLRQAYGERILLGAGTITTRAELDQAAGAGASFLVSPGCDPELGAAMVETGLVCMIGALTPSEVMLVRRLGADIVKLFPGSLGGPAYLQSLRAPFPEVRFVPTGGVGRQNLAEWLAAGAYAVGMGGSLVPKKLADSRERVRVIGEARGIVETVADLHRERNGGA